MMTVSPNLTGLLDRWRKEASDLRTHYFNEQASALTSRHVAELQQALEELSDVVLNLAQASRESGYSQDHLGRLLRDGTIPNAGRTNVPRIRRGDLPIKPGSSREPLHPVQNARADSRRQFARSIVTSNQ
jgi:hypothetical protein